QLRLSDPFGMCELTRSFSAHDTLTVIPRVEPTERADRVRRLSRPAEYGGRVRRPSAPTECGV
ncbi:DUF58 domain-containing protein, partial [Streptomyces sp. NPDC003832]